MAVKQTLTDSSRKEIVRKLGENARISNLSLEYGISEKVIRKIKNKEKIVVGSFIPKAKFKTYLTLKQRIEILKRLEEKENIHDLAKLYNVD